MISMIVFTRKKILFLILVVLTLAVVSLASAAPDNIQLGYDNGSYSSIPFGSYTTLNRIDMVWYVNGVPITAPSAAPSVSSPYIPLLPTGNSFITSVAGAGLIAVVIVVAFAAVFNLYSKGGRRGK